MKSHIHQPRIQAKPARGDIRVTRTGLIADGMGNLAAEFESNKLRHTHLLFDFDEMTPHEVVDAIVKINTQPACKACLAERQGA